MKTALTSVLLLMAGCVVSAGTPPAAQKQPQETAPQGSAAQDKTPPSYDMKPQAILDLQQMQEKYLGLRRRFRRRNTPGARRTACAR